MCAYRDSKDVLKNLSTGHDINRIGVDIALFLAGRELIFFLSAGRVLCFGFTI